MIHFAVVMGVVPAVQQVRHALADALDATRYFAGDRFEQVGPSGGWVAAGIAAVDPLCEPRVVACGDALAVLDGSGLTERSRRPAMPATTHPPLGPTCSNRSPAKYLVASSASSCTWRTCCTAGAAPCTNHDMNR